MLSRTWQGRCQRGGGAEDATANPTERFVERRGFMSTRVLNTHVSTRVLFEVRRSRSPSREEELFSRRSARVSPPPATRAPRHTFLTQLRCDDPHRRAGVSRRDRDTPSARARPKLARSLGGVTLEAAHVSRTFASSPSSSRERGQCQQSLMMMTVDRHQQSLMMMFLRCLTRSLDV